MRLLSPAIPVKADSLMALKNVLAFVAVRDLEEGSRWYKMLLGREPDTQPMKGLVEWQFEAGGWLQVNENKQLAGRSSVTFVERTSMTGSNSSKKPALNLNQSCEVNRLAW